MPSTFLVIYLHLVFSTNGRKPFIAASWRPRLHRYLAGTIVNLKGVCEKVGGTDDHVHLLVRLGATKSLADVMRELKRGSSMWVHTDIGEKAFEWQEGYAAFSVSASVADEVRRYIETQEEHHRERDFREELKIMLVKSGVKFDEKYLD